MAVNSYAALLRGVNVGGRAKVGMEDLRSLFTSLGHTDVASYVQSGNIVFKSSIKDVSKLTKAMKLTKAIEQKIRTDFDLDVTVLIRSAAELRKIQAANPLIDRSVDPTKLHVTFLRAEPKPEDLAKLREVSDGNDELAAVAREIYLFCPDGYGNSKLNNALIEKRLGIRATTRNWRTVVKLVEMTG
jgi:uncharacterized protein (DUF1697 family)